MVGWMHTLTDRRLFMEPADDHGDDQFEDILGELPPEIRRAGPDVESEFRRHRQAMMRLARRRQPFFVSEEV